MTGTGLLLMQVQNLLMIGAELLLVHVQNMWGAFMQECAGLAERHPYVIKPSGKQVGSLL